MADQIAAFWAWWNGAKEQLAGAINRRERLSEAVTDEISARVETLAAGMRWELGPSDGGGDRLTLALCWNGDIAQRRLAETWLAGAPRQDPAWDYAPARPPGAGWERMSMEIGDARVTLGDFVCAVDIDKARERVDVVLHHAVGAKVGKDVHANAAFLMLDRAFGEDGVERWLGDIDVVDETPEGALPIDALGRAVRELEASATGEQFQLLQGEREGRPLFALRNAALKAINHLACDHHVEIRIPLAEPTHEGLTTKSEADALNALEDALCVGFPRLAYHGRETHGGARTLLVFASRDDEAALAAWAEKHRATATWRFDPAWAELDRWDLS